MSEQCQQFNTQHCWRPLPAGPRFLLRTRQLFPSQKFPTTSECITLESRSITHSTSADLFSNAAPYSVFIVTVVHSTIQQSWACCVCCVAWAWARKWSSYARQVNFLGPGDEAGDWLIIILIMADRDNCTGQNKNSFRLLKQRFRKTSLARIVDESAVSQSTEQLFSCSIAPRMKKLSICFDSANRKPWTERISYTVKNVVCTAHSWQSLKCAQHTCYTPVNFKVCWAHHITVCTK